MLHPTERDPTEILVGCQQGGWFKLKQVQKCRMAKAIKGSILLRDKYFFMYSSVHYQVEITYLSRSSVVQRQHGKVMCLAYLILH